MELSRSSLPDQVFHRLAADVLAGGYAPRERLPTQRALAATLGVNMASVREGVKRLERLCRARDGRGGMLNSGALRLDERRRGRSPTRSARRCFASYPYWLWRGRRDGRRRA